MHNDQIVWEELLQPRVYIKGSENISGGTGNLVKGVGQDWDIWTWRVCETDLVGSLGRIFQAEGESTRGLGVSEAMWFYLIKINSTTEKKKDWKEQKRKCEY